MKADKSRDKEGEEELSRNPLEYGERTQNGNVRPDVAITRHQFAKAAAIGHSLRPTSC